jgi:hypothetical protein
MAARQAKRTRGSPLLSRGSRCNPTLEYSRHPLATIKIRASKRYDPLMITNLAMWLGAKDAGAYVGMSPDWAEARALEWPLDDKPVQGRIRYRWLRDNPGDRGIRRFYRPDIDAFLYKR